MNLIKFAFTLPLLHSVLLFAEPDEEKAAREFKSGNYKAAIKIYEQLAEKAIPEKKGEYLERLAVAYYQDQEHAKGFETYLYALELTPKPMNQPAILPKEKPIYEEALSIYLDPKEREPEMISLRIRDLYAGIWRLHPDYVYLGYVVSIAYANLGEFDDFFSIFYKSYKVIPDHYLAYKTKAILHIKLFDRARSLEEKESERRAILIELDLAKQANPHDFSLYRMQIAFAPDADKRMVLDKNLNEIINNNIIVPRSDLNFYFDQLFAYGQLELAEKFLEKSKGWYPYSRTIDAAHALIDEKRKNNVKK